MSHDAHHRPGTVPGCDDCRAAAYEPGWYATLLVVDADTGATSLRIAEDEGSITVSREDATSDVGADGR